MWQFTLIYLCFKMFIHNCLCCSCTENIDVINRFKGETGNISDFKEKRQLRVDDYGSVEFLVDTETADIETRSNLNQTFVVTNVTSNEFSSREETTLKTEEIGVTTSDTTIVNSVTTDAEITTSSSKTTIYINEDTLTSEQTTIVTDIETLSTVSCGKYKSTDRFDIRKMADVWKIVFYTIPTTLKCFRLHIKQLTIEDRKRYEGLYGDFKKSVRWINCTLEISSSETNHLGVKRRHFLQNSETMFGVMENIIIDQKRTESATLTELQEESPDQWLVVKNLLLMRDCNSGDIAIFSRVPSDPLNSDIEDALAKFGEDVHLNGTRACEGSAKTWVKVGRGSIE